MTIRDVTRPIELTAEVEGPVADSWVTSVQASTSWAESAEGQFGRKWNALMEGGGAVVADQVRLKIDAEVVGAKELAPAR